MEGPKNNFQTVSLQFLYFFKRNSDATQIRIVVLCVRGRQGRQWVDNSWSEIFAAIFFLACCCPFTQIRLSMSSLRHLTDTLAMYYDSDCSIFIAWFSAGVRARSHFQLSQGVLYSRWGFALRRTARDKQKDSLACYRSAGLMLLMLKFIITVPFHTF